MPFYPEGACGFCDEITGELEHNLFARLFEDQTWQKVIVKETDNFVVMPTIGAIVEGYLLILPRVHYLSMAHLPRCLYPELEALHDEIRAILTATYAQKPIFFEHGPMSCLLRGGCCADHAHLHAVPLEVDLAPDIKTLYAERRIQFLIELRQQVQRSIPYLFYEDPNGKRYVFDALEAIPQYLRQLVAKHTGLPERWDWRVSPGKAEILATIDRLRSWGELEVRETSAMVAG